MRNTFLPPLLFSFLLLSACGGSDDDGGNTFADSALREFEIGPLLLYSRALIKLL